jgi:hypothetical protein
MFEGPEGRKRPRKREDIRDQDSALSLQVLRDAEGGVLIPGIEDDHTITGHDSPTDAIQLIVRTPQSA